MLGGFAALAGFLKEYPRGYLLIDSGDFFQGTPEGDLTGGEASVACMNALGYHAAALGNHEFDLGQKNLWRLSRIAKFPFIAANVFETGTGKLVPYVRPYVMKDIDGVKVAVVGLTTSRTRELTMAGNVRGLDFRNETETLRGLVKELEDQGVKVIIVASHVGFESDSSFRGEKDLARDVPQVHLILGGHSHDDFTHLYQDEETGTFVAYNPPGLRTVTKVVLRVWRNSGKIFHSSYDRISLDVGHTGEDPGLKALVDSYREKVAKELDREIGSSRMVLNRKGTETLLGNWQTDVVRRFAGSDVAFQNIKGSRADLPKGPVTLRDIYLISPFNNTIVTMDLSGSQIKEVLERSVSGPQGFLQVSGLKMIYDGSKAKGQRVVRIEIGGNAIDPDGIYRVATNDFLAQGGDGFTAFTRGRNVKNTMASLRDVETEFVRKHSPISARIEGRITGE